MWGKPNLPIIGGICPGGPIIIGPGPMGPWGGCDIGGPPGGPPDWGPEGLPIHNEIHKELVSLQMNNYQWGIIMSGQILHF